MERNNYKEIGEIINKLTHTNSKVIFGSGNISRGKYNIVFSVLLVNKLADYFERDKPLKYFHGVVESGFTEEDRKQFLKGCGVK